MPSFVRVLRGACLALVLASIAACSSSGGAKRDAPAGGVNALYAELDRSGRDYETALQQSRAGNAQAAHATLVGALDRLKNAAARCGATAGCDPQRFFAVFDRLLRLKDGNFIAGDDAELAEDAPEGSASGKQGAASLPEAQRSVTLLHGHKLSDLIAMNGPVKAALEMWLTQWRGNLMDAYVSYQYMRYEMWPQYQQADLPEAVLFGIMAKESGGKVHAVSRSGAAGPLQFMYATGMRFGLTSENGFDLRFDPAESARANAEYLNEQLGAFNNNLELALGAYNGGEGRMQRTVGADTAVSFYDPRIYNQLSQETRDYVPGVLAAAWLFLHPDSYNLTFPKINGAPGSIVLKRPASISELTVCMGSALGQRDGWFRTLRNLNPRLDPQVTQPVGASLAVPKQLERYYAARCTDGPWPILAHDLHTAVIPVVSPVQAPPPAPAPRVLRTRTHKVKRGETLTSIVRPLSCTSLEAVARMNGLKSHTLHVGQTLRVPSCR